MNSTIEGGQNNSQGPLVIGNRDAYSDASDENGVNHEVRPQRANFRRSVSEGPQVPIPKTFQVPPDAPIPEFVQVLRLNFALDQVSQPYQRRTNSRSRHHQLYIDGHKVQGLIPTERKTRPKKPIDYTEGQLPPGLTYEDLFKRCSTPPSKRRRAGDTKSTAILIVSSSDAEPHIQDELPRDLQEVLLHDIQDEPPHESDNMSMIDGASSHTVLELNSGTQKAPRSGSQSDNVTNELPQTYEVPSPEEQLFPELNEEPNIGVNVSSRPNSGEELHVVVQPQNFSSETYLITGAEKFVLSNPPASRQGDDGVNNETANGEILNSVENRARDLSEIEDSQLNEARRSPKRIKLHHQNYSPVHELDKENVNPVVITSQQLFDHLNQINQHRTHRFNVETSSDSCPLDNPVSGAKDTERSPPVETPKHLENPSEAGNVNVTPAFEGTPAFEEERETFIRESNNSRASDVNGTPAFEEKRGTVIREPTPSPVESSPFYTDPIFDAHGNMTPAHPLYREQAHPSALEKGTPAVEEERETVIREPTPSPVESSPFYTDPIFDARGNMTPAHPLYREQVHPSALKNPSQNQAGPSSNVSRIPSQTTLRGPGFRNSRIDWSSKKSTTKSTPYPHGGGAPSNQPVNNPSSNIRYRGNVASELRRKANQEKIKRLNESRRNK